MANDLGFMNYACIVVGTGILLASLHMLRLMLASRNWPSVSGRIVKSKVEKTGGGLQRTEYKAELVYRYQVQGTYHNSSTVGYGQAPGPLRVLAEKMVRRYRRGAEVVVYYDPKKPSRAVLEPGWNSGILFLFAMGLLLVIGGLMISPSRYRS